MILLKSATPAKTLSLSPTTMGTEELPPSYLSDTVSDPVPVSTPPATLTPLLLPPLYAPSPSSPFLVASSPSLDPNVPRSAFLSLVKAINSSLQPTPFVRRARTTDTVVTSVPVVGQVYGFSKWFFGGLGLSLIKESVRGMELLVGSEKMRGTTAILEVST